MILASVKNRGAERRNNQPAMFSCDRMSSAVDRVAVYHVTTRAEFGLHIARMKTCVNWLL